MLSDRLLLCQPVMNLCSMMRRLHAPRPQRESHARALATKSRIWEARPGPIQAGTEPVAIGASERAHLRIGIQILIRPERSPLRLSMRGEPRLGERRAGAEAPYLRWHVIEGL